MYEHTPYFRDGAGEPLVLLNGPVNTWRSWEMVIPYLTDRFDVLAMSIPGNAGTSSLPSGSATVGALIDALEALLDSHGVETAHLAGYSGGGWFAMELARRGRARSVWAFSPAGGWQTERSARRCRSFFRFARLQAAAPAPVRVVFTRPAALRKLLLAGTAAHGDRMPYESMDRLTHEIRASDFDLLHQIVRVDSRVRPFDDPGVPVTIAWAEVDRLLPAKHYADAWKEAAPFAAWHEVSGVGHMPTYDDPRLIADLITRATERAD